MQLGDRGDVAGSTLGGEGQAILGGEGAGQARLTLPPTLPGVELGKPTHFTVNAKAGGRAPLDVQVTGPGKGEAAKDLEVVDNHDGTHTVKYTPVQQVSGAGAPPSMLCGNWGLAYIPAYSGVGRHLFLACCGLSRPLTYIPACSRVAGVSFQHGLG